MRNIRDTQTDVIINIIDDAKAPLMHDIMHSVTETLKNLTPMTRPERKTRVNVCATPLKSKEVIISWIYTHVTERSADVDLVQKGSSARTLQFRSDMIHSWKGQGESTIQIRVFTYTRVHRVH